MSFQQSSCGPPASPRQLSYLLTLVKKAGFEGFVDARQTMGFTQRQARGKFTGREASDYIDALLTSEQLLVRGDLPGVADANDVVRHVAQTKREASAEAKRVEGQAALLRGIPADLLADELRRRGWIVSEPV